MDTSLPSTNAAAAWNLFRLGAMLGDGRYTALAKETVAAFEPEMLQYPWLFPGLLAGVVASRLGGRNWVVAGDDEPEEGRVSEGSRQNGAVGLSEFFKALDVAPRGELRALVSVEGRGGRQEWVTERRGGGVVEVEGKGGVFCIEGQEIRRFMKSDLGDFTGQG